MASVVAVRAPMLTVAPTIGMPPSVMAPLSVPTGPPAGGSAMPSTGCVSAPSTVLASQPMPRRANTDQIVAWCAPANRAVSACRIALRMSRKDGSGGESRIACVTIASVSFGAAIAVRRSHRVCAQISPSSWTSGPPAAKSP